MRSLMNSMLGQKEGLVYPQGTGCPYPLPPCRVGDSSSNRFIPAKVACLYVLDPLHGKKGKGDGSSEEGGPCQAGAWRIFNNINTPWKWEWS